LIPLLDETDRDIQERAVRLLCGAGQAVVHSLLQRAATASRPWQHNAIRVLCAVRGKTALKGLLQLLLTGSDELNKTLCDLLTPVVREMDPRSNFWRCGSVGRQSDVKQQPGGGIGHALLGCLTPGRKHAAGCSSSSAPTARRSALPRAGRLAALPARSGYPQMNTPNCCQLLRRN
jgi:hypothetical protein